MRLGVLQTGGWGAVFCLLDDDNRSPVIEGMKDSPARQAMLSMLENHVPKHGPTFQSDMAKRLKGEAEGICEFRKNPRGSKLRTFFFEDQDRFVICTSSTGRKTDALPMDEVRFAQQIKKKYFAAKAANQIEYVPRERWYG